EGIFVAGVSSQKRKETGDEDDDHGTCLGHPLRQRQQCPRCSHQLAAKQDRQRVLPASYSHHSWRWLRSHGSEAVKPAGLRMRITVLYTVIFAALFAGFFFSAYHLFKGQLDRDARSEVTDRAEGLRGYLKFENEIPTLRFGGDVPEFLRDAYQIYDPANERVVTQSP